MKLRSRVVAFVLLFSRYLGRYGRYIGVSIQYYQLRRRFPNLINPRNISEYILSSLCKTSFLQYADLADKVKVREYVKSKGLGCLLLEHYAVWDNVDDIELSDLPNKFILKPNNGSGGHVYCRCSKTFDLIKAKQILRENLSRAKEYFYEPHYLKITPKIFAEQLLDLGEGRVLTDYKFTCVKGDVVDVFLASENSDGVRKYATLDTSWTILPYTKKEYLMDEIPQKPADFDKMLEYAKILSEDFPFVRVDLYEYMGAIYFSELTFTPWGGYMYSYTDEAIEILGEHLRK